MAIAAKTILSAFRAVSKELDSTLWGCVFIDNSGPVELNDFMVTLFDVAPSFRGENTPSAPVRLDCVSLDDAPRYIEKHIPAVPGKHAVKPDFAILVAGFAPDAAVVYCELQARHVPVLMVSALADFVLYQANALGIALTQHDCTAFDGLTQEAISANVGSWLLDACPGSRLVLAQAFPFIRALYCKRVVSFGAWQNTGRGALWFLRGSDMPAMTANQVRMVLHMAAAHGYTLDYRRVPEIAGVIVLAYGGRRMARRLLAKPVKRVSSQCIKAACAGCTTYVLGKTVSGLYRIKQADNN